MADANRTLNGRGATPRHNWMRLDLPRAIRQLRLPASLPWVAVILGLGFAGVTSLLVLSHGLLPWRTAWLAPSNAKYAICFTVRPGVDRIGVAERIAGPHPYVGSMAGTDEDGREWQCTPIPTRAVDGLTALHEAERVWEQVRGDSGITGSYMHSVGAGDMFGR